MVEKFATGVVDTGGAPWLEKIRNGLNGILWGWGETDSWKNQSQNSRDTV